MISRFWTTATTFVALTFLSPLFAQVVGSLTPVLVGSTGNFSLSGNIMLSASTGECVVPTWYNANMILTQGFQQPTANSALALTSTIVFANSSCVGANDGTATLNVYGGTSPFAFTWSGDPADSLQSVDSLSPGTYTVTVTDAGGLQSAQTFTITENTGLCGVHVYSGLTPNGDGHNDLWLIDYLELFIPNTVHIYNRWGVLVWDGVDYDNVNVVWNGTDANGNELVDGTYYYLIEAGGSALKGWVELSH